MMVEGFGNTILITLGALAIGVVIGTLIAVVKYCAEDTKALKPLAWLCDIYVTVIRGVPVVVLLLIFYFIIMTSAEGIAVGILTFGINSGAYMAELIRGGINSVDRGQMEAGRSLGMSKLQAMRKIIFPQALRYILPAIGNELIALLKETSILGMVGATVGTLTFDLNAASGTIFRTIPNYLASGIVVGCFYLAVVYLMVFLIKLVEKRMKASDQR